MQQDNLDLQFKNIKVKPEEINYVIYHGNKCPDGFWSALSARNLLGDKDITYYAAYDRKYYPSDLEDKCVAICDFCYDEKSMREIIKLTKGNVVVLDHHEGAQKDLEKIPDEYKVFDMTHSGAYITWRFFNREKEVPRVIKLVEYRDLWDKKRPEEADQLFAYHELTGCQDVKLHMELLDEAKLDLAIKKGSNIKEYIKVTINEIKKYSITRMCKINNRIFIVEYINSQHYKSDLGNILLTEVSRHADFAVVYSYSDTRNYTSFSLRSEDDRYSVLEVAKSLRGGGHRNASGCGTPGFHIMLPVVHYETSFIHDILDATYDKKVSGTDMIILNTCQYPWNYVEWLGRKNTYKNICVWHIAKRGVVLYFWINTSNSTRKFHEIFDYDKIDIDNVDFKIGDNCNPKKPLFKVTLSSMPSFIKI